MVITTFVAGVPSTTVNANMTLECGSREGTCEEAEECHTVIGGYANQAACQYQAETDCIGICEDTFSDTGEFPVSCTGATDVSGVYVDYVDINTCHVYCGCVPGVGCECTEEG
jgi:hypothetical protein